MVEKCCNCKHIEQLRKDENAGACKDCNNENNSVNWQYDKSLDDLEI